MPNFVDDLTTLAYPKSRLQSAPVGQESKYLRAIDWNELCQALIDTRGAVLDLRTLTEVFAGDGPGLVPASDGLNETTEFLRKDGTYAAPSTSSAFSGVSVYKSSFQSILHNNATIVTYDSEEYDTNAYHSTTSDTSRLTAPTTGYYFVRASVEFGAPFTGGRNIQLLRNGSTLASVNVPPDTTNNTKLEICRVVALTTGQYMEVRVHHTNGNVTTIDITATVDQAFQMHFIGS